MASSSHIMHMDKLTKDNYDTWKLQMEALLVKNDFWGYVSGKIVKREQNQETFDGIDLKARADIILSISPSELCHVKHCKTSREVWNKLKDIYESKGPARKASLLKQLLFAKMDEDTSMDDHLTTFFNIVDKLKEMEIQIADDMITILLLYSIPNNFDNFRCAIESRDVLPSPEQLKIKLLEETSARSRETHTNKNNEAFFAKNTRYNSRYNSSRQENNNNKSKIIKYKCNYCKKVGHKAADCYKRKAHSAPATMNVHDSLMITEAATLSVLESFSSGIWCLDSGATSHMCNDKSKFTSFTQLNDKVRLASNETARIIGKGTVKICLEDSQNKTKEIELKNTLFVPELRTNLLSIPKATQHGKSVIFLQNEAIIQNPNKTILLRAKKEGKLYILKTLNETAAAAKTDDKNLWHYRYGHLNEADLTKLINKGMVHGINVNASKNLNNCEICITNKQTVAPFPKMSTTQTKDILELVHSDICGPMPVKSNGGAIYFATFIDDKSRWIEVYFLKHKSEVKQAFMNFKTIMENQHGKTIKILRTDNGLEYCGKEFTKYLEQNGIKRQRSTAYTPQQNGVSERMNRTLTEMARCMLSQSKLNKSFWAEAINTAAYIRNRAPTKAIFEKTPYEEWFNRKPVVAHFRIFGCKAYFMNKNPSKTKFEPRSAEGIFVGYSNESKAYRIWHQPSRKIIISRDVKFVETINGEMHLNNQTVVLMTPNNEMKTQEVKTKEENEDNLQDDEDKFKEDNSEEEFISPDDTSPLSGNESYGESSQSEPSNSVPNKRGPGRPKLVRTGKRGRPRKEFNSTSQASDEETHNVSTLYDIDQNPNISVDEALSGPNRTEWMNAMKNEFEALKSNHVWSLVNRPKDKNIIGCKWVLKTKFNSDGTINKYKARLVAKGCSQRPGQDYNESYSPVARLSSVRLIIAISVELDLKLYQLDVVMAYINGDLHEEVYMEQAKGFEENENQVYHLHKSLYGLKQSGRQWHEKLDVVLQNLKFKPLNGDKCVYLYKHQCIIIFLVIYVDDIIAATNDVSRYNEIKALLSKEFEINDLGILKYCLGIQFENHENGIILSQKKYINDILSKYNMENCKPQSTPMDVSVILNKNMKPETDEEINYMKNIPYRSLIGSLMFLAVCTRPDISYTVNFLSQFNENPGPTHWVAAKRILRYLQNTKNYGLFYKRTNKELFGYVDSDWARNVDDRLSYTGYIFKLGNAAVSWAANKQKAVATSSNEAEYMAMFEAVREIVYLRFFIIQLGRSLDRPIILFCDNNGAIQLAKDEVSHSRVKHIDIKYHYIRNIYRQNLINVQYLSTNYMVADILTKPLPREKHLYCMEQMGLYEK